jgi:cytochrome c oxidase subunit 2
LSIGAGTLPNEPDDFLKWVAAPKRVKPGVLMPAFGMLPQEDLRSLAVYLESLQ